MEFDYLILGGGTAGCVVAGELARRQAGTVAVIEHGSQPVGRLIRTPALYSRTFGSRWDYGLETVAQAELRGRRIRWPRGKMLGGSSGINAMIYSRGSPKDFEAWPTGWQYPELAPFFAAIEQHLFNAKKMDDQPAGIWQAERPEIHPLSERFLQAGQQAGFGRLPDGFVEAEVGVCQYVRTQYRGRRLTTYDCFLKGCDVHLITQAEVQRILIGDQTATGVHCLIGDQDYEFRARKALILSAGAIHSPLILQRSGIGPPGLLREAGVDVVKANEFVGENLQDHLVFPLVYKARRLPTFVALDDREARAIYAQNRSGPLTSNIAEVGGFARLPKGDAAMTMPAIQWHFMPTHFLEFPTSRHPPSGWTIGITLLHPQSRGRVRWQPKEPMKPWIDPAYFAERSDLELTMAGVQQARCLAEQGPLAECHVGNLLPGAERFSEERLETAIRAYATTIFHPVGTCRIGLPGQGVVDGNLQVHGVANLYLADASVIPMLPSANPQAVVMMIGARLASILAD